MMRYILFISLFFISCEKENLVDPIIDNEITIPDFAPISQYKTSHQNHEWNDGWFSHTDRIGNGGTSTLTPMGSLTYFDYGNDGDQDVFVQVEDPDVHVLTYIIENKGKVGKITQWKMRRDVISEALPNGNRIPCGGRKTTQADIDGDGDTDIVFFCAADQSRLPGIENEPGGAIIAFIYDELTKKYSPIEIEPYQGGGNEYFYHGGSLGDVNGDGLVDIVAGTTNIKVWINQGNLNFNKQELPILESPFICSQTIFDLDQDGLLDLIVSDAGEFGSRDIGYIIYGLSEYPYFDYENKITLTSDRDGSLGNNYYDCMFDVSVTDWDNDGDFDLFTSAYQIVPNDQMSFLISYFESTPNGFINRSKDIFKENENENIINNSGLIKTWDIDNDGNKELLIEASVSENQPTQQGWNSFKLINGKLTRSNL